MAHTTIEYMILIPVLILQIFLLPCVASAFTNSWSTSSQTIALQENNSNLSSAIQQLYYFLNSPTVSSGTVTSNLGVSPYVGNLAYVGNASVVSSSGSSKVLKLTLTLVGSHTSTSTLVTLGSNIQWLNSSFTSNSAKACISAYKDSNSTIWLSFRT